MVHLIHGMQHCNKKERTIDACINLDESPGNYPEWKKPLPIGYILHSSIYTPFPKCKVFRDGEQISSCQRVGKWLGDGSECGYRRISEIVFVVMEMSCYLDCINANVLPGISYCGFVICYHWGKQVQYIWSLSPSCLTTLCERSITSKSNI